MDSRSLPPRQMWAAAAPHSTAALHGRGGPAAGSPSQARILDNGSSLVVSEASSTGGSGLYARPMQGVDEEVINDLSATLNAMYLARRRDVEDAGCSTLGGRPTAAIMQDNPTTVAMRSVAVLQRLCNGVLSDAAFQRIRLQRLNGTSARAGAPRAGETGRALTSHGPLTTPPATTALRQSLTGAAPQATQVTSGARPAASTPLHLTPAIARPDDAASAMGALSSAQRPTPIDPLVVPPSPPPQPDAAAACSHPAACSPPVTLNYGTGSLPVSSHACESSVFVSSATLPTLRSCRELQEMWLGGKRDSIGVIVCHPLSILCSTAERQKLFPGRLLRADAVRATRYKRVVQEISDVGGIDEFEKKWGKSIVSNVYKSLTTGSSKGGGGKKRKTV